MKIIFQKHVLKQTNSLTKIKGELKANGQVNTKYNVCSLKSPYGGAHSKEGHTSQPKP